MKKEIVPAGAITVLCAFLKPYFSPNSITSFQTSFAFSKISLLN
jgi:hypothetical protein